MPVKRYHYPFALEKMLRHAILSGQRAKATQILDRLFGSLVKTCPTLRHLKSDLLHLSVVVIRKCYQSGVAVDEMLETVLNHSLQIIQANSVSELNAITQGLIQQLLQAVGEPHHRDRQHTMRRAIQYMRAHYHKGLSLEDVAGVVGLSYSYFSRLFSQETGMSFSEYLTQIRHNAAKQLLLTTPLTVEEISAQVGYEDASHFIRVFKRCSGVTPRRFAQTNTAREIDPETGEDLEPTASMA